MINTRPVSVSEVECEGEEERGERDGDELSVLRWSSAQLPSIHEKGGRSIDSMNNKREMMKERKDIER